MNKTQAAEFLGVSVRALERYTAQSRVAARYEKGKTRSVLVYDQGELKRFKTELETALHRPSVDRPDANTPNSDNAATAMAPFGDVQAMGAMLSPLLQLAQAAQEATPALQRLAATRGDAPRQKRHAPTEAKLLLSVEEAQSLTGLSRNSLMEAIRAGRLAARKVGRAWRIKRRDLEAFIDAL